MKTAVLKSTLTLLMFLGISACSGTKGINPDKMFAGMQTEDYNILTLAATNENLSIITDLIQRSNLDIQLLFNEQPITMFLPTNEAFQSMSINELEALVDPSNSAQLMTILKRHILPTKVMAFEFENNQIITTSTEEDITIRTSDKPGGYIYIGGAQVIKANVEAENGVIHVVNRLIEPTRDVL